MDFGVDIRDAVTCLHERSDIKMQGEGQLLLDELVMYWSEIINNIHKALSETAGLVKTGRMVKCLYHDILVIFWVFHGH